MIKISDKKGFRNILLVIIVGVILVLFQRNANQKLYNNGKYTIGTVIDITTVRGGKRIHYEFKVYDFTYKDTDVMSVNTGIGMKHFIIFDGNKKSKILAGIRVPDTLTIPPRNGWDVFPLDLSEKEILKAINK